MAQITLKMLRAKKDWSQREAAERIGVSAQTWNNWEKQNSFPDVPKIKKIEEVFGISYDEILFFDVEHGLTVNDRKK